MKVIKNCIATFLLLCCMVAQAATSTITFETDDSDVQGSMSSKTLTTTESGYAESSGIPTTATATECGTCSAVEDAGGYRRVRYYFGYYDLPPCPYTRPGYRFVGWKIRISCSRWRFWYDYLRNYGDYFYGPFSPGESYMYPGGCQIVIKPIWERVQSYKVILHRNNSSNDGATASRSYPVGSYSYLPTISSLGWVRSGYEFVGWGSYSTDAYYDYYDGERVYDLASVNSTKHLYAIWRSKGSYTVRLHRNNSSNDGATAERRFNIEVGRNLPTISELNWLRDGYSFLGWSTYPSSSSAQYSNGQFVNNLSRSDGGVVDLYAVWKPNASYTVRLYRNNSSGDSAYASRKCLVGVGRNLPTISELGWQRQGYTFLGWSTYRYSSYADYSDGGYVQDLTYNDGGIVSLYAVWAQNAAYIVRLHRNKDSSDSATAGRRFVFGAGRYLPTIDELGWSRTGYEFEGWALYSWAYYPDYDDGAYIKDVGSYEGEEIHFYAVWRSKGSYTVELHRNNSSADGATARRSMNVDVSRALPTISSLGWTRNGYAFVGWSYYDWSGWTDFGDGESVVNLSTDGGWVNLYAVWNQNAQYAVRLHRNYSSVDGSTASRAMTVDVSRSLPTIGELGWSRQGYTFVGWGTYVTDATADYADGQSVRNLSYSGGDEVHLYAIWKINEVNYSVKLHRNKSPDDGATASRALVTGKSRALPTVGELGWTREGYEFVGWAMSSSATSAKYLDGQAVVNLTLTANSTVHLYAVWRSTEVKYTVRLFRNNSPDDGASAARSLTVGKSRVLPTISELGWTRAGYKFAGWGTSTGDTTVDYSDGQSVVNLSSRQGAEVKLYAIWTSDVTYSVRLHRNNSSSDGATASRSFTVGKSRALPSVEELGWTRNGYEFAGWATSPTSHFTSYYDGQSVRDLSTTRNAVVHLYAVWYRQ